MGMVTGKPGSLNAEINITPLVDVVLVLLIIFMVVGPMLDRHGKAVALPVAAQPATHPENRRQLLLVIDDHGAFYVGSDPIDAARLGARLAEAFARDPAAPVLVKADRRLRFGEVKRALLAVRDAGFRDAGLVATKP